MYKVSGLQSMYAPIKVDGARTIVSYNKQDVDNNMAAWNEVYLYRKQTPIIGFNEVKNAILADINEATDKRILSGFTWTPEGGEPIPVWLSSENQFNFKAAYDVCIQTEGTNLPIKFKLGELEDETPIYHTFTTLQEFTSFYAAAIAHIQQCLADGWTEKDAINWQPYQAYFPQSNVTNE